jgi:hypothetical protein
VVPFTTGDHEELGQGAAILFPLGSGHSRDRRKARVVIGQPSACHACCHEQKEIGALLDGVEMHRLGEMIADEHGHPDVGLRFACHPQFIGRDQRIRLLRSLLALKRWPA